VSGGDVRGVGDILIGNQVYGMRESDGIMTVCRQMEGVDHTPDREGDCASGAATRRDPMQFDLSPGCLPKNRVRLGYGRIVGPDNIPAR
jgi:hypothetical protein